MSPKSLLLYNLCTLFPLGVSHDTKSLNLMHEIMLWMLTDHHLLKCSVSVESGLPFPSIMLVNNHDTHKLRSCCSVWASRGRKKKKLRYSKEGMKLVFFSYYSRPWFLKLSHPLTQNVPTFLSRVFLHLSLSRTLSKCLCYWSFLAWILTWLPAYLSVNHFSLNPYTSNIPLKCHSQLLRQNSLTVHIITWILKTIHHFYVWTLMLISMYVICL